MGCTGARERIKNKISLLKLERMIIQIQKEKILNKLSEIEGHTIKPTQIPDYIDPIFAKEKDIYDEDEESYYLNRDKKADLNSNTNKKINRKRKRKIKRKGKGKSKKKNGIIKSKEERNKIEIKNKIIIIKNMFHK